MKLIAALTCCVAVSALPGPRANDELTWALDTLEGLDVRDVDVAVVEHRGEQGLRVTEKVQGQGTALVLLADSDFQDGTIEVELAGAPRKDAQPGMRGFVGIAFRLEELERMEYECFYLRPTNGRADDQLRRNHATQYVSHPDYPWHRLRREQPGVYESYVDLEAGAWTSVRIVVEGEKARLFVHGEEQPALIVNDLKRGLSGGQIALWIGTGTAAHFRDLKLTRSN